MSLYCKKNTTGQSHLKPCDVNLPGSAISKYDDLLHFTLFYSQWRFRLIIDDKHPSETCAAMGAHSEVKFTSDRIIYVYIENSQDLLQLIVSQEHCS